jgi:hypothetical protein
MSKRHKAIREGMFPNQKLIRPGDVEALVHWLDQPRNHKDAVDAVAFAPDNEKDNAFIHFIVSAPEFQGWDPSMVSQAVDKANELDLMETGGEPPRGADMSHALPGEMDDMRSDAQIVQAWQDAHHDEVVDVVQFSSSPVKAIVDLLASQPEFRDWDYDRLEDAVIDQEGQESELMETMKKITLEALVAKAVKNGVKSALNEASKPKTVKITRTQLAEGVRKALRQALKENAPMAGAGSSPNAGGAMPPPGAGAGQQMSAPAMEGVSDGEGTKRGSSSFGQIPPAEELQAALDEVGGWDMTLRGSDSEAFDAAMEAAGLSYHKAYSMMQTGEGMHKVLTALMSFADNTANGEYADQGEPQDFESSELVQSAESLASSILDVLGWEWI